MTNNPLLEHYVGIWQLICWYLMNVSFSRRVTLLVQSSNTIFITLEIFLFFSQTDWLFASWLSEVFMYRMNILSVVSALCARTTCMYKYSYFEYYECGCPFKSGMGRLPVNNFFLKLLFVCKIKVALCRIFCSALIWNWKVHENRYLWIYALFLRVNIL